MLCLSETDAERPQLPLAVMRDMDAQTKSKCVFCTSLGLMGPAVMYSASRGKIQHKGRAEIQITEAAK